MEVVLVDVGNDECLNGVYKPTGEDPELLVPLSWELYPHAPPQPLCYLTAPPSSCSWSNLEVPRGKYEEL